MHTPEDVKASKAGRNTVSTTEDTYTPEQFDEFDRWLAAHDAATRAAALEEAELIAKSFPGEDGESVPDLSKNVYVLAVYEIAAAIRAAKEGTP